MILLEGRVIAASQHDIKRVGKGMVGLSAPHIESRDQALASSFIGNAVEDGIERLERVAWKVHLCDEPRKNAGAKEGKVNVRWAPCVVVILPRVGSGLDRLEAIE